MSGLEESMGAVNALMAKLLAVEGPASPLYGMMRYHLGWADEQLRPASADSGKRLRVRLVLLACEAAGGRAEAAVAPAAAVELIHNFSLIHDDIQDNSEYRRHRRTVWSLWGAPQGINAGDSMFTAAQLAILHGESAEPRIALRAVQALNHACRLLCEGQFLDLDFERRASVSVAEYYAMIERKTAALIEAACFLGALYGGADEAALAGYAAFGKQLGLAFQAQDDYLGIWGDPATTGKSAATDIESKKKTLPLLYALSSADPEGRAIVGCIMSSAGSASPEEVSAILDVLNRCGAADHTQAAVERATQEAVAALASAHPEELPGQELAGLCRKLVGRKF